MNSLKDRTERVLLDFVDEENVCLLIQYAELMKAEKLKKSCKAFTLRNYTQIASTEEYRSLPDTLLKEMAETRKSLCLGYAVVEKEVVIHQNSSKSVCSVCKLPLVYDKKNWEEKTHPKELLQNALMKKNKKTTLKYIPVVTKSAHGHFSKIVFSFGGKQQEIQNIEDVGANKRDAEAKISVYAFHKLVCESK